MSFAVEVLATLEHVGVRRVYRDAYEDDTEDDTETILRAAEFAWFEGNYSCDCNRLRFWRRVGGELGVHEYGDKDEYPCGDGGVRLIRLVVNGAEVKDYTKD